MKKFIIQLMKNPELYKYILVGGVGAIIDLSLFFLLRHYLDLHYLILGAFSLLAATLVNFILCNNFVFKHNKRHSKLSRFVLTYLVSGIGFLIHVSCLFFAVEWLLLPILMGKFFAMGAAFGWNFLSRKYFVFQAA